MEVPLRCRDTEMGKLRQPGVHRSTLVWACLGVCSVMLVKAVVIGGLASATISLLDPRFGGVDGLGVLTIHNTAAPAREQELDVVGRNLDSFRPASVPVSSLAGDSSAPTKEVCIYSYTFTHTHTHTHTQTHTHTHTHTHTQSSCYAIFFSAFSLK
jgi:carbohydrate-binding DOMON domain-containing protein